MPSENGRLVFEGGGGVGSENGWMGLAELMKSVGFGGLKPTLRALPTN